MYKVYNSIQFVFSKQLQGKKKKKNKPKHQTTVVSELRIHFLLWGRKSIYIFQELKVSHFSG